MGNIMNGIEAWKYAKSKSIMLQNNKSKKIDLYVKLTDVYTIINGLQNRIIEIIQDANKKLKGEI